MYNRKLDEKILTYAKKLKLINHLGGKCKRCDEGSFFTLTFHHKDSKDKDFEYGSNKKMRFSKLINEIDKCELLCQNCHRELHYNEKVNENRRLNKLIYLEYGGCKCIKCNYDKCPASLTFHHKNSKEKDFWIGCLSGKISSIEDLNDKIKKEIDKCDVLCANCHVLEHSDLEFFDKNKNEIHQKMIFYKEIQSKLDRNIVKEMYLGGKKQIEIAKHFNTSKSTISGIIKK